MTATATPAAPAAIRRAGSTPRSLLPAAEGALALVTAAAALTLWRLFDDWSFLAPLLVHAAAAHAVCIATRRRGWNIAASGAATLAAATLLLVWLHLGDTTAFGIPTGRTASGVGEVLRTAWSTFGDVRAPAPVLPGFLLAAGAAVWVSAWLADIAAFRLWTPFEALIPSGTIFVFASLFAADQRRAVAAAVWVGACLSFVLLHRTARQQSSPAWLGSDPSAGTAWFVKAGLVAVAATVALGLVVGPRLPTADAEGLVDIGEGSGDGSRTTISPLVEIKGRLTEQSDLLMFSATTSDASVRPYWRLTSLDIFDGSVWSSRGSFEGARGDLRGLAPTTQGSTIIDQDLDIAALAAIWLPAAFEPRRVDAGDVPVRWEAATSTLIVSTDFEDSDGVEYAVRSAIPALTPEALASTGAPPPEIADRALGLPPNFPTAITDLARAVTAGATTPYDQAMALQQFFRSGEFTYDLNVPPSHSNSAMEEFLFVTKAGYCEQFSGTYAAMARAIGLPARVAVGFTPGAPAEGEPGLLLVRGENAHAWPEVWIPEVGWVAFEPTPGRGSTVLQPYTGTPEQQDTPGPSTEPTDPSATIPPTPDTTATTAPGGVAPPTTAPPGGGTEDEPPAGPNRFLGFLARAGLVLLAVAAAVVLAGASVAGTRAVRRWRRHQAAAGPDDVVLAAWADQADHVAVLGLAPRSFETPAETALRFAGPVGDGAPHGLAVLLARAQFSPDGADEADAEEALALAAAVRDAVHRRTTTWQRVRSAADPRRPDRRTPRQKATGPRIQVRST